MRDGTLALIGLLVLAGCAGPVGDEVVDVRPAPSGPYLGQQPPGTSPELFQATALAERDTAWTPDGGQLFYSLYERNRGVIVTRVEGSAGWSDPEYAPFGSGYSELEPFVTADGGWLYFISKCYSI